MALRRVSSEDEGSDSEESPMVHALEALEERVEDVLDNVPPLVHMAPFKGVTNLHWKRGFAREVAPQSFEQAFLQIRAERQAGILYRGSWTLNYYMVENIAVSVASIGVRQVLNRPKRTGKQHPQESDALSVEEVATRSVARAAVVIALQPFSNMCTFAVLSPEPVGVWQAWKRCPGPAYNGASARALSAVGHLWMRELVVYPTCSWLIHRALSLRSRESVKDIVEPAAAPRRFSRSGMVQRINEGLVGVYTNVISTVSTGVVMYPLESIRMRIESQYVVFGTMKYAGVIDCVNTIWSVEGLAGFYKGFFSWALAVPVELLWPMVAWSLARLVIQVAYDDDDAKNNQ